MIAIASPLARLRRPLVTGALALLAGGVLLLWSQAERNDVGSRGSFRLSSKPAEDADDTRSDTARKAAAPASVTQCIETNTRCLLSCPQADPDAAFLCASQCRSRFKSCKSRAALR